MKGIAASPARRRWLVASHVVAGTLGAYGLTSLATVTLSLILARAGMARTEAVIAATLASFAVFAVISMAVFHATSAARAWAWLTAGATLLAPLVWLLIPGQ